MLPEAAKSRVHTRASHIIAKLSTGLRKTLGVRYSCFGCSPKSYVAEKRSSAKTATVIHLGSIQQGLGHHAGDGRRPATRQGEPRSEKGRRTQGRVHRDPWPEVGSSGDATHLSRGDPKRARRNGIIDRRGSGLGRRGATPVDSLGPSASPSGNVAPRRRLGSSPRP